MRLHIKPPRGHTAGWLFMDLTAKQVNIMTQSGVLGNLQAAEWREVLTNAGCSYRSIHPLGHGDEQEQIHSKTH